MNGLSRTDGALMSSVWRSPWALLLLVPLSYLVARIFFAAGVGTFTMNIVLFAAIYAVLALGQTFAMGFAGVVSFGHPSFAACGAYTYVHVSDSTGSPWMACVAAAAAALVMGLLVALPLMRLRGFNLGMATLGVLLATQTILSEREDITGGRSGMAAPWLSDDPVVRGPILVSLAALLVVALQLFVLSRRGRDVIALRDDEAAAVSLGIDAYWVKSLIFAVSAGLTGLGGALFAAELGYVTPDTFAISMAINLLAITVIGGFRSPWGAVLGAVVFVYLQNGTTQLGDVSPLVYGGLFVIIMVVLPSGLTGLLSSVVAAAARRRGRSETTREVRHARS